MPTDSGFSKRFATLSTQESPLAQTLRERIAANQPVFDLTEANPTRAGIALPAAEILRSLSHPDALSYRPHPLGMHQARVAIANYYLSMGKAIEPEQVVLTTGSSEALGFLLKLLCDSGQSIAVPAPGYPLFDFLATLEGVNVFRYRLRRKSSEGERGDFADWSVNFDQLEAALPHQCKALICVAPNNPTGSLPDEAEWARLDAFAAERNMALVVDEVFRPYRFDGIVLPPLRAGSAALFTLNGFSKLLGLPQLKLGWILVEGPERWKTEALERLEIIADTYLSVATPIQTAVPRLLEMDTSLRAGIEKRIRENLNFASEQLGSFQNLRLLKPRAGWYLPIVFESKHDDETSAIKLLQSFGVHVHPGHLFDFAQPNHLVISLLPEPSIFKEGIRRLKTGFESPLDGF